jgi:hypothetical protein
LGEQLARGGSISDEKIAEAAHVVAAHSALAREAGATAIEVVVTAPGREHGSGRRLLRELRRAAPVPVRVRVLSSGERPRSPSPGQSRRPRLRRARSSFAMLAAARRSLPRARERWAPVGAGHSRWVP